MLSGEKIVGARENVSRHDYFVCMIARSASSSGRRGLQRHFSPLLCWFMICYRYDSDARSAIYAYYIYEWELAVVRYLWSILSTNTCLSFSYSLRIVAALIIDVHIYILLL